MENPHPDHSYDVAARIAGQTLANRRPDYSGEVRRLLDAGREVMGERGTASRPRVADIVEASGLSNDAFYRHFVSKDSLVAAILEDGMERLRSYLAHQMAKETTTDRRVRRWVEGVLAQADGDGAVTTLAVLWNAGTLGQAVGSPPLSPTAPLAGLLVGPFAELGSDRPELDATLVAHAMVGRLTDHLWERSQADAAELDRLVAFTLATATRTADPSPSIR